MLEKSPEAFKTISEAAEELGVEQHVLRFWETKFPQIKPLKRRGGRRYYRPEDMELLHRIQHLLYKQGYTIKGAKKALGIKGEFLESAAEITENSTQPRKTAKSVDQLDLLAVEPTGFSQAQKQTLQSLLKNLEAMRKRLQSAA